MRAFVLALILSACVQNLTGTPVVSSAPADSGASGDTGDTGDTGDSAVVREDPTDEDEDDTSVPTEDSGADTGQGAALSDGRDSEDSGT